MVLKRTDNSDDRRLLSLAASGQREGYCGIMRKYGAQVRGLIVRMVADGRDAEELAQDTFVKAFRHIASYNPGKASLPTWLLRIAYNEAVNHLRQRQPDIVWLDRRRENQNNEEMDTIDDTDPIFNTADDRRIALLEEAVDQLPAEERTLLTLHYYNNMSLQDIAQITGLKAGNVALRLFRTRRKLQLIIENRDKKK